MKPWDNYAIRGQVKLKKKYMRPEYEINNQLEDIILYSTNETDDTYEVVVDIEEILGIK